MGRMVVTVRSDLRVHIVGGPGSGKSTIGAELARRIGTRALDLDDVALSEGAHSDRRPRRALEARIREVEQFSAGSTWVSGGTFLWWSHDLFERADVVIWLDPPWGVARRRIVSRHALEYARDVLQARGLRARLRALRHPHIRSLLSFFRWSKHYYTALDRQAVGNGPDDVQALTRTATADYLLAYRNKVVRLPVPELKGVLAALANDRRGPVGMNASAFACNAGSRRR